MPMGPRAENESRVGAAPDRRHAERHPCDLQPFWTEWGSGRGESPLARVRDISAGGIGLLTGCRIRPGSVLVLRLFSESQGMSRPLLVRIIHSHPQPDGQWLSGGAFVRRLSDEDLEAVLAQALPEPPAGR